MVISVSPQEKEERLLKLASSPVSHGTSHHGGMQDRADCSFVLLGFQNHQPITPFSLETAQAGDPSGAREGAEMLLKRWVRVHSSQGEEVGHHRRPRGGSGSG